MANDSDITWIYRGPEGDVAILQKYESALAYIQDASGASQANAWAQVCTPHIFDQSRNYNPVLVYAPQGEGPRLLVDGYLLNAAGHEERMRPENATDAFRDLAAAACARWADAPQIRRFVADQCYAGKIAASIGPYVRPARLDEEAAPWANSPQWADLYRKIADNAKGGDDIAVQFGKAGKGGLTLYAPDPVPLLDEAQRLENLRRIIPEKLLDDPLFMRRAIQMDPVVMTMAAPSLKTDAAFIDLVVETVPRAAAYIPQEWLADRDFVLGKLQKTPAILLFAAPELRGSRDFILDAVARNGMALAAVAELWGHDREIVAAAVANVPNALEFAADHLRDDKDIVQPAVARNGYVLHHAGPACRADREVVRTAALNCCRAMEYAHPDLQKDRALILDIAEKDGDVLLCAAPEFLKDTEIVCAAMRSGRAFSLSRDIPKAVKADLDVALNALYAPGGGLHAINHSLNKALGKAVTAALTCPATMAAVANGGAGVQEKTGLNRFFGLFASKIPAPQRIARQALDMGLGLHPQLVAKDLLSDPAYVRNAIAAAQGDERSRNRISRDLWHLPMLQGHDLDAITRVEAALEVLKAAAPPRNAPRPA